MATRSFGLIMHGVTGRMGYNQHLVRSIVAIRARGRRGAPERRPADARSDPRRPQRRQSSRRWRGRTASTAGPTISTRRWPTPTTRSSSTPAPRRCAPSCCPARSTPASTSIARSRSRTISTRRSRWRRRRKARRRQERRGAGQAVPAGAAQARACCATPGSSAGSSSVRGEFGYWVFEGDWQPAQRPSWNYRRRTAAASSSTCSATGATCSTTSSARCKAVSCLGATHIPKRVDEVRQGLRRGCRRRGLCDLRARRRGRRADQLLLGDAGAPRRSGDLPGRRHPRLGRRRADTSAGPSTG